MPELTYELNVGITGRTPFSYSHREILINISGLLTFLWLLCSDNDRLLHLQLLCLLQLH